MREISCLLAFNEAAGILLFPSIHDDALTRSYFVLCLSLGSMGSILRNSQRDYVKECLEHMLRKAINTHVLPASSPQDRYHINTSLSVGWIAASRQTANATTPAKALAPIQEA